MLELKCGVCGAKVGCVDHDGHESYLKGDEKGNIICPNCGNGDPIRKWIIPITIGVLFVIVAIAELIAWGFSFIFHYSMWQ
jgi:DNA-directed RNA polymerase subunit RPC12/RpoP